MARLFRLGLGFTSSSTGNGQKTRLARLPCTKTECGLWTSRTSSPMIPIGVNGMWATLPAPWCLLNRLCTWMTSPFVQPHSRSRSQTARSIGTGLMTGLMLLVLLAAAPAMAEPPPSIDIRWEAPPDCPQENDVRERIQNLLGSGRHDNHLRAEGTITRMDRRFRLDLVVRVRDLVGTRSIEANSCEDFAGAAAVELGLLIHSAKSVSEPSRSGTLPPTFPPARGSEPSSSRSDGMDKPSSQGKSDASPKERTPAGAKSESKTDVEKDKTDVRSDQSHRARVLTEWTNLLRKEKVTRAPKNEHQPARNPRARQTSRKTRQTSDRIRAIELAF